VDKPREWTIAKSEGLYDSYYEDVEGPDTGTNNEGVNRIQVVEKSAYDALQDELYKLQSGIDQCYEDLDVMLDTLNRSQKREYNYINDLAKERAINAVLVEELNNIASTRCAWQLSQDIAKEALTKAENMRNQSRTFKDLTEEEKKQPTNPRTK